MKIIGNEITFMRSISRCVLMCMTAFVFAILFSCTSDNSDDVEVDEGVPLTIGGGIKSDEQTTTRAQNLDGLEKFYTTFYLYGYKCTSNDEIAQVFPGYEVRWTQNSANTTSTNTFDWEYVSANQSIKYWDFGAKEYRFFATTSETAKNNASITEGKVTFSFADINADELTTMPFISLLWYSNNVAPNPLFGNTVTLEFIRPICKVRIMFVDADGQQYTKTDVLKNVSFKPTDGTTGALITKGSISIAYPIKGTAKDYTFTTSKGNTIDEIKEPYETGEKHFATTLEKWYTLIPPGQQGSYTLTVKLGGAEKTAVVPETYMQWKPGYAYTYIFKVPNDAGIFLDDVQEVALQKWVEQEEDHPIYNW